MKKNEILIKTCSRNNDLKVPDILFVAWHYLKLPEWTSLHGEQHWMSRIWRKGTVRLPGNHRFHNKHHFKYLRLRIRSEFNIYKPTLQIPAGQWAEFIPKETKFQNALMEEWDQETRTADCIWDAAGGWLSGVGRIVESKDKWEKSRPKSPVNPRAPGSGAAADRTEAPERTAAARNWLGICHRQQIHLLIGNWRMAKKTAFLQLSLRNL